MYAMTVLSTENLTKILDRLVSRPSWAKVMASIGASERLAFVWRAQSVTAAKDDDRSSPFFLEWRGAFDYWHNHAGRARVENIITYEAQIRDECVNGRETPVLGPDQRPIYRERPEYIGKSDEWVMLSEGCSEGDVKFYRLEHDAKGHPVPLTKVEFPPAPVRLRVLEQDRRYVESKNLDVNVTGEIVHAKPLARLPGEQRPDVARLRELAAMTAEERRAALGASGVAMDANGRRALPLLAAPTDARADDAGHGLRHPAPGYVAPPKPTPEPAAEPRPSYARPERSMDHTGRGEPGEGGGPANGPGCVR